jgi:hypothetical protein
MNGNEDPMTKFNSASRAKSLREIVKLLTVPLHELDGALVSGDLDKARRHLRSFHGAEVQRIA